MFLAALKPFDTFYFFHTYIVYSGPYSAKCVACIFFRMIKIADAHLPVDEFWNWSTYLLTNTFQQATKEEREIKYIRDLYTVTTILKATWFGLNKGCWMRRRVIYKFWLSAISLVVLYLLYVVRQRTDQNVQRVTLTEKPRERTEDERLGPTELDK